MWINDRCEHSRRRRFGASLLTMKGQNRKGSRRSKRAHQPSQGKRSVWAAGYVDQIEQLRDVAAMHRNRQRQHCTGADEVDRGTVDYLPSFAGNPHHSPRIVAKVEIQRAVVFCYAQPRLTLRARFGQRFEVVFHFLTTARRCRLPGLFEVPALTAF
ncbi:MAG: hypothetical protein U0787_13825 [Polyangia bacterium]